MPWEARKVGKQVHIVPTKDLTWHDTSRNCICGPAKVCSGPGGVAWQHHALDKALADSNALESK